MNSNRQLLCKAVCVDKKKVTSEVIVSWLKHEVIVTVLKLLLCFLFTGQLVCSRQLINEKVGENVCVSRPP